MRFRRNRAATGRLFESRHSAYFLAALLTCVLAPFSSPEGAQAKEVISYFGTESGTGTKGGEFRGPNGLAVNSTGAGGVPAGTVYVVDQGNVRIQRFSLDAKGTSTFPYDDTYEFVSAWGAGVLTGSTDFEICTVSSQCLEGVASAGNGTTAGNGSMRSPRSIAVDEDTGWLYVGDGAAGQRRVNVYTAEGEFLRSFGWDVVASGPGDTAADKYEICIAAAGDVCQAGAAGSGVGQFGNAALPVGPLSLAVSPADGSSGTGTLFAADGPNHRVNTFALDGSSPGSFGSAVQFADGLGVPESPTELTVDSRGIVYAADPENGIEIERYDTTGVNGSGVGFLAPLSAPPLLSCSGCGSEAINGLAVDADSDGPGPDADVLYVLRRRNPPPPGAPEGNTVIQQFGPSNPPGLTAPPIAGDEIHGSVVGFSFLNSLAVDGSSGRLFVGRGGPFSQGVATGPAKDGVYVLDTAGGAPSASLDSVTDITTTSAKIEATVDPNGPPDVSYQLEYSLDGFKWQQTAKVMLGGQEVPQPVEVALDPPPAGLDPNTLYHVRVAVSKPFTPPVTSAEMTFTTEAEAPQVETVGAPVRTATTAQLNGRVNPRNKETTYHFEYGGQGPCSANPCASSTPVAAGKGSAIQLVGEEVDGLQPGAAYHYRLVADNGAPGSPSFGEDMTLTTRASEAPLSHGDFPGPPGSDRAYEMVSLPDSGGNPIFDAGPFSADGDRAIYSIAGGTPISGVGSFASFYFAERTGVGWLTRNITPPRSELVGANWSLGTSNPDLSTINVTNYDGGGVLNTFWRLSPQGGPARIFDVVPPMTLGTPGAAISQVRLFASESPRVVAMLHPTGPSTSPKNLYDITSGSPELVSLLPDGTVPACGPDSNVQSFSFSLELSSDGRFLVFPSQGDGPCNSDAAPTHLYLRDLEQGETKLITPTPISGPECGSGASLQLTSKALFFWTQDRLSPEDTPPAACGGSNLPPDGDVYRYEIQTSDLECVTCVIPGFDTDVSASTGQGGGKGDIGLSIDGSRVYFRSLATTPLVPGATVGPESTYVINTETGDLRWAGRGQFRARHDVALFTSKSAALNPLGGTFNNGGTTQLYRYDESDRSLVCVSCPQDGSAPTGSVLGFPSGSADGDTIAFATTAALVSADQNTPGPGHNPVRGTDVYEWRDGRLFLITDGLTDWPPFGEPRVAGVSASGRDLYFTAFAQYTPDALDAYNRLYDARIGGGFEYPEPSVPCPLEVCQGTPKGAPEEAAPGTGVVSGPGNLRPTPTKGRCPKGQRRVRRAGKARCVKRPARQKRNRRANRDRRVGR